jgi:3-hydroxyacyl-CoA dehydrogenase
MSRESRSKQLNVRLTTSAHDVIRALAFLEDTSEADVVRQLVENFVSIRKTEPEVREALRLLAHHRARAEGTVSDLPSTSRHRRQE